jgi:hypothetical protein
MKVSIENVAISIRLLRRAAAIGIFASVLALLTTTAFADNLVTNGSFSTNNGNCRISSAGCATGWSSTGYTFLYTSATSAQTTGYSGVKLWGPVSVSSSSANGFGPSPDGGAFAALDGDYSIGPVTQTITGLTPGYTYVLSFYWAAAQQEGFTGPTIQAMNVCLGTSAESYKNTSTQPLSGATNASSNLNCSGSGASTPIYDLSSEAFSGWEYETYDLTANSKTDILSFLAYGNVQVPPFALLDGVSLTPTPEPGTLPLLFTGILGGLGLLRSRKWRKN